MPEMTTSSVLRTTRQHAPQPSAALLALQEKGFELSGSRFGSVSPFLTHDLPEDSLRVSPLSIVSTPPEFDRPLPLELEERWQRRRSSTGSGGTTITGILNLYINLSQWSLKSEYEEMTPYPDDSDEDERPPSHTVHQPKAYRDTIAPLLEHQFSSFNLTIPPAPSPQSVASLPKLVHPNANASVTSLQLTPEPSPDIPSTTSKIAGLSQTSIQITPDTSPLLPATDATSAPTFQQYSQVLAQRKIALEVPDVRDADSWYDQPLSPISPENDMDNRLSQQSETSEMSVGYKRQMAYDTLAPPLTKKSPNMRPVSFVQDDFLPGPMSATVTHVIDNRMVPPPLDLTRDRPPSRLSEEQAAAQQAQEQFQNNAEKERQIQQAEKERQDRQADKTRQASQARSILDDPIEGPMQTYLTPDPPERKSSPSAPSVNKQNLGESLERPSSAFSSDSSDSDGTHGKLSGQFKAIWRDRFKKKKEKGSKDGTNAKAKKTISGSAYDGSVTLNDDAESYRYPYKLSHISAPIQSAVQISGERSSDLYDSQPEGVVPVTSSMDFGRSSNISGPSLPVLATADSEQKEIPSFPSLREFQQGRFFAGTSGHFYSQSASTNASRPFTPDIDVPEVKARTNTGTSDGKNQGYNDTIFEASGGKKKSGFASRLLMSSEEKRKMKVKESITIVGSVKMNGSSISTKPLVQL